MALIPKFNIVVIMISFLVQTAYSQNRTVKTREEMTKVKALIAAVESDPNNRKAHEAYIAAMNVYAPDFLQQYNAWMQKFPKSAIVPFEVGKEYEERRDTLGKLYLLKALAIDSNLSDAWVYLSSYAWFLNQKSLAIAYMGRATKIDPKNADYAYKYAYLYRDSAAAKYDSLMVDFVYHFPDNDRAADALYRLAEISYNADEKTAYYENLYNMFSTRQPLGFKAGMWDYYNYLINTDPEKAFDLALRMVLRVKVNRGYWKQKLLVARQFIEAGKLLDSNKSAEAVAVLNRIDLQNSEVNGLMIDAQETLTLYKARAEFSSNDIRHAYDTLAIYYSKLPSDRVRETLLKYAKALGMDSTRVEADIWKIRDSTAWKETDFTLQSFEDNKKVSLSDYRGKIVLVTYWFPNCAPCRKEFPYFEAAVKKYHIPYLAINVSPQQDDQVMPVVKNSGYTFVPLRSDPNKSKGNLPNTFGAPRNFLIDQKGRVIFSDFLITEKNERTLDLMISELLEFGAGKNTSAIPADKAGK